MTRRVKGNILVSHIMKTDIVSTVDTSTIQEVAQLLMQHDIGSILIFSSEKDKDPKIITKSDIVRLIAGGKDPHSTHAKEIASGPLITVQSKETVENAMLLMAKQSIKRLVVRDSKQGRILGILSTTDILKVAPGLVDILKHREDDGHYDAQSSYSGYCDACGNYSDELGEVGGYTLCEVCQSNKNGADTQEDDDDEDQDDIDDDESSDDDDDDDFSNPSSVADDL